MSPRALWVSLLAVAPCFWQSRIQAGDLPSHVYNAWLVHQIRAGHLPGLHIEAIQTNVLFDLVLERLCGWFGYDFGTQLAMSMVVLTFFWGAWAWLRRIARVDPMPALPLLLMVTYGWSYHSGFVNYYWAMGFAFWALMLAESDDPITRWVWWGPLVPGFLAHALPVGWTIGVWSLRQILRRTPTPRRVWVLAAAGVLMGVLGYLLRQLPSAGPAEAGAWSLGADQVWLFSLAFLPLAIAFQALTLLGVVEMFSRLGVARVVSSAGFQTLAASAMVAAAMPNRILFPGYTMPITLLSQRLTLPLAVAAIWLILRTLPSRKVMAAGWPMASVFFGLVYVDTARIQQEEDLLRAEVLELPRGARVLSDMVTEDGRVLMHFHLLDRACIGHCFSYGNYEPASEQFRVRVDWRNPYVVPDRRTTEQIEYGGFVVQPYQDPIHHLHWDRPSRRFTLRVLRSGDRL